MDTEGVGEKGRGEIRTIESEELRPNQVRGVLYIKSSKCESAIIAGCYVYRKGTIFPYCDAFAWHYGGFKCAWPGVA